MSENSEIRNCRHPLSMQLVICKGIFICMKSQQAFDKKRENAK